MNPTLTAPIPTRSPKPLRRWLWAGPITLAAMLAVWGAWTLGLGLWADATGLQGDFDFSVNGQPWAGGGLGGLLGWAIAATVVAVLLTVALAVLLPLALGGVLLGVLLSVGLVLGVVALPVLLVLALLLSPLLALAGLAWMLFA